MAYETVPLAIPEELLSEIRTAADRLGLSMADVMRQSTKLGLPELYAKLITQAPLKIFVFSNDPHCDDDGSTFVGADNRTTAKKLFFEHLKDRRYALVDMWEPEQIESAQTLGEPRILRTLVQAD